MDWKKIILKDTVKFRDVLLKIQLSVVDLVGSIHTFTRHACNSPASVSDIIRTFHMT